MAQVASPLPQTLFLPASGGVGGEIFRTDVGGDGSFGGQSQTGSGAYGDILPGTNIGAFGRAVSASDLNTVIRNYNANFGDQLTPAGLALVNAGLLSRSQLLQLRADSPNIAAAPAGQRKPGVDAHFGRDPGPALQYRRPLCGGAQRVGIQCSQLRQLRRSRATG